MCGKTRRDKIRNENIIRERVGLTAIVEKNGGK